MFKEITGKEALGRIMRGEDVHFRESDRREWNVLKIFANWDLADFLSDDTSYTFAIKTEPMRTTFTRKISSTQTTIDTELFVGKHVRITTEEIEP